MIRILDRRSDSRNKSSVNRGRFLRRFRQEIRKAVSDILDKGGISDIDGGRRVGIPAKDLAEPQFALGPGGVKERVHPGNDTFSTGDQVDRPPSGGGGGGGSKASPDGEGEDAFTFSLTRDEFLEFFFEELALPNLVRRHLASIETQKWVRAGYTQSGVPANISFVRTMRGAAGRRVAAVGPARSRALELEARLETCAEEEREGLRLELAELRRRLSGIPFLDTWDLRYNNRIRVNQPTTRAVMFCLMDVSGSMDEPKKNMAKRFFTLLYLFLKRNYERIEVVFIRHTTTAEEVDEERFFHSRESGGTVVSTALRLMDRIIQDRYAGGLWNIYGAQASDGDNWQEDSSLCLQLMNTRIIGAVQYFAYLEVASGRPQNLWEEYARVQKEHPETFAMRQVATAAEIYPVFHELFRRRVP